MSPNSLRIRVAGNPRIYFYCSKSGVICQDIKTHARLWCNAAWFVFEPFRDHGVDVVGAQPPVDILCDAEQEVGGGLSFVVLALDVEA